LPFRQVDPQIRIQGRNRHALQQGGGHPGYLESNLRFAESVEKPSERRKLTFISHLSSGVAARLRAKRILSCSLSSARSRSLRNTLRYFFCLAIEGFWHTAARRANGLKNVTSLNRQMDLTADFADNADVSGIRAIRVIRGYFFLNN